MNKLALLTIVAIVLIGVVVFIISRDTVQTPTLDSPTPTLSPTTIPTPNSESEETSTPAPSSENGDASPKSVTVIYSDSGYSPSSVSINKGDTVVFDNQGSSGMWTASAVHPIHSAYPSSHIGKCGTAEELSIFDACRSYTSGASWEFRFDEVGTWRYHNHLSPGNTGTIIVE